MGSVFEDCDLPTSGNLSEGFEVGWETCEVNGNDHSGTRSDCGFDGSRIDVSGLRIDIDKDRLRSDVQETGCRRREGQSGDDPFSSRSESECMACAV